MLGEEGEVGGVRGSGGQEGTRCSEGVRLGQWQSQVDFIKVSKGHADGHQLASSTNRPIDFRFGSNADFRSCLAVAKKQQICG